MKDDVEKRAVDRETPAAALDEPQFLELMHRLAAPLDEGSNALLAQLFLEFVAAVRLQLVILVNIETMRIAVRRRRKGEFFYLAELPLINGGYFSSAFYFEIVLAIIASDGIQSESSQRFVVPLARSQTAERAAHSSMPVMRPHSASDKASVRPPRSVPTRAETDAGPP